MVRQVDTYSPCEGLCGVLLPAYAPCHNFGGPCEGIARWNPRAGHMPRGFIGALGTLEEVELVLLTAEPGDPLPGEMHSGDNEADYMERCCKMVYGHFDRRATLYHRNVRKILDKCFPNLVFSEQLRKAWIVDAYLCSAPVEGGSVPVRSWRACAQDYLVPQLNLLRDAAIVALGRKAQQRVKEFDGPVLNAFSVAPPGCNRASAKESWEAIPKYVASMARNRRLDTSYPAKPPIARMSSGS